MSKLRSLFEASPASVVRSVRDSIARRSRELVLEELASEVGAKNATPDAIIGRIQTRAEDEAELQEKGYDTIGGTEVSFLKSRFADQPKENLEILAGLYETHPWVFVCTQYIATSLAGIPLRIMRATGFDDGMEVVEGADETPVGAMFRWINPHQSPFDFVEALTSWLLLTGEAYIAYTDPAPGPDTPPGVPAELWVLFSPFVEKVVSPRFGLVGYEYNVGGEVAYFDQRDIVHFKTWSPAGRWRGQGVPVAGIKTLQTDQELRDFNRRVLAQGVHISGVLETENEDLNEEQARKIRGTFNKQYAGSGKAAKVAVLWGGLKFNPTSILQKDVMMDEQKIANRDEVISSFGLKPELLTEKFANKATAETVRRMAYEDTILGRWGRRIISTLNATGLRRFGPEYRATFDSRDVPALQTSLAEKLEAGAIAINGAMMTPNEVRTGILGLDPLGSEMDIPLLNGRPVDQAIEPPEPPQLPPGNGNGNGDEDDDEGEEASAGALLLKGTTRARVLRDASEYVGISRKADSDFLLSYSRRRQTAEIKLERAIRSVYRDIAQDVRPLFSRSVTYNEILAKIEQVYFLEGRNEATLKMDTVLREIIDDTVQGELVRLGVRGTFNVKPVRALNRLSQQKQRIRNMWGKDWRDLRRGIGEGLAQGRSEAGLTQIVDEFFDGRRANANTIARTETLPAVNGATQEVALSARANGNNVVSVWVTSKDEKVRTRPQDSFDHRMAEGLTIVPGEEMFVVSGERMEFPGDSWNGASAGNTINCRCGVRNEIRKIEAGDNRRGV